MAKITAAEVNKLRKATGAGMMDCKKALSENEGDIEKAEDWLRKKGINTAQKKSSRLASEGLINVATGKKGSVIVEINSETDFVARNETFQKFCDDVANTCLEYEVKDKDLLLKSNFINSDTLVETELTNVIAKLGENIVIRRLNYVSEPGLFYQKYLHNAISSNSGKIGVLLSFSVEDNRKDVESFTKQQYAYITV
jgi:elongation factor Ts